MVKRSHPRGSRRPEPGPESDEYLQSIESDDQCSEDGSGDEGLQLGADGVDGGDMVDADFEFYDPADGDVRGIRAMLQSLMDGAAFDVSELVDVIIHQKTVGSVVKTGQESDPVGVISVLNIQRYSSLGCIAELKGFILSHCPGQGGEKEQLSQVLSSPHTGLLINERLLNSPPELGPPLQQALFDEIQWATEDEPTQELRESFKFQQYVSLTRVFRDPKADAPSSGTDAVATKKRRRTKQEAGVRLFGEGRPESVPRYCQAWSKR
ncbi:unnamed protein product [Ostreobium quekettii]|uniref:Protein BCCIP homolog n=1 Tax=Ostreobium quekettii TaxID=121088 RepID=A0A8S1JAQ3_9CHLO|nr:unnamed protein product [Ostreobium quekettii]